MVGMNTVSMVTMVGTVGMDRTAILVTVARAYTVEKGAFTAVEGAFTVVEGAFTAVAVVVMAAE